jgi:hypothetical protein
VVEQVGVAGFMDHGGKVQLTADLVELLPVPDIEQEMLETGGLRDGFVGAHERGWSAGKRMAGSTTKLMGWETEKKWVVFEEVRSQPEGKPKTDNQTDNQLNTEPG